MAVAEFSELTKIYKHGLFRRRELRAIDGVSFSVNAGEVFGLVGPNRAGKTTLIKVLLTLTQPTSGMVRRFGHPVGHRATLARVGYMHENQAFPRYWNARGLLQYYGALSLLPEKDVRTRVPSLLERVGLADRSDEPIRRFSKGMVQRLALAQALLNQPELLVLDEPTEGLDLDGRQLVHDIVTEQKQAGKSVLLVSHLAGDVEKLCDRIAVLKTGKLRHIGPVAELCQTGNQSTTLEVALQSIYDKS